MSIEAVEKAAPEDRWLTPGVRGIGAASLLADAGHEIPTALLPTFLTSTLGPPASALGLIEGVSDGLAGAARLAGGALADDPHRRRATAVGGYASTAILSGLIGVAGTAWQAGVLRAGAWASRGLRVPARNALLADTVPVSVYGRAYGFERAMDNLGAIVGPLLALALVGLVGVRTAILLSVIPGMLAVVAIIYAIRKTARPSARERQPIRLRVRPVLRGQLGRLMMGVSVFELGNVAATLTSVPAGRLGDRRGTVLVLAGGIAAFGFAYVGFAATGASIPVLAACFILAGIGIGAVETAEHSAFATMASTEVRGSAFGVLAGVQSLGNLVASAVVGVLYTTVSAGVAFVYPAVAMAVALPLLAAARRA